MDGSVIHPADVAKAIDLDPVATYRAYRGVREGDELFMLPEHCRAGIARYVILGIKPGHFLTAIFAGERDLAEMRADAINRPAIPAYEHFLQHGCPAECSGSPDMVRQWCERGGLLGQL